MKTRKVVLSMLVLLATFSTAIAQLNIKVGYNTAYYGLTEFNKQLQLFNESRPYLEDPFPKVHWMHGLELGARFKVTNSLGIELTWLNGQARRIQTSGFDPSEVYYEDNWRISSNEYSVGLENYISNFGYGVSLGYRNAKVTTDITGAKKYFTVHNERFLNSKLYVIFTVETASSTFAFKPYYQIPLGDWSINPVADRLNPDIPIAPNTFENFKSFGLSLVFYNGRK